MSPDGLSMIGSVQPECYTYRIVLVSQTKDDPQGVSQLVVILAS